MSDLESNSTPLGGLSKAFPVTSSQHSKNASRGGQVLHFRDPLKQQILELRHGER
jgi:hypothetical protein